MYLNPVAIIAAASRVFAFEKIQLDSLSLKKLLAASSIDEAYAFLRNGIEDFSYEMEGFSAVSKDVLFHKLTEIKSKEVISIEELAQSLHSTVGFINTAVYCNSNFVNIALYAYNPEVRFSDVLHFE